MPVTTSKLPTPDLAKLNEIRPALHPNCIVCSPSNPAGLKMQFDIEEGNLVAEFSCPQKFEGYQNRLQGGVISSLMDGIFANYMFACGIAAVTAELSTRFRHPVKTGIPAKLSANLRKESHGVYFLEGKLYQEGQLRSTASAKFIEMPADC